jgi:hypothetical protein
LRIKLHNVSGNIVHHVAILKRFLDQKGIQAQVIKGFCVIPETKEACEHYWTRVAVSAEQTLPPTFLDLDIGFEVAKLRSPELQALHPVLLESLGTMSSSLTRSDEKEFLIRDENERLFELLKRDPKAFWLEAPRDVESVPDDDPLTSVPTYSRLDLRGEPVNVSKSPSFSFFGNCVKAM